MSEMQAGREMDRLVCNLRQVEENYKNKLYGFGEIRITDMAKECADAIEKLKFETERLRKVVDAAEKIYEQIDLRGHTHSLDMSGYHGLTISIPKGEKGKEYWQAMWAYNEALEELKALGVS